MREMLWGGLTWRRAAIYWGGFLVLAAYYFTALHEGGGPTAAHLVRAPFLDLPADEIAAVEVRRGDRAVRCRRAQDRWQVVEPLNGVVPSDLIAALVANLTQLPDVEVVAEHAADLAQFGLAPAQSEITLTRTPGKPISVRVGAVNPAGTAVYAQRSDGDRVFLIGMNVRYYEDLLFQTVQ